MAKPLKADKSKKGKANGKPEAGDPGSAGASAAPQPGHNFRVDIRASIQRTAFKKLWELDREIAAVRAAEIKPLQEGRSEVWKTLRNDLDAKAADLSPLYALYKRDRQLAEIDDEDEAKKSQDMLREGFETLATGQTLDFLTVLGAAGKPRDSEPEHIDVKTARAAGREAGRAGKNADANPHAKTSDLGAGWEEGRGEAMAERVREMGEGATAH